MPSRRRSSLLQGYQWEPNIARYRSQYTGRFVARTRITELLDNSLSQRQQRMARGTVAVIEGNLSPGTWLSREMTLLKRQYLQNAALAAGGWDRLTAADYGRIGGKLRGEYGRLANMAEQIARGEVSAAQGLNRIRMYLGNARQVYYQTERERLPKAAQGMAWIERRILSPVENCKNCRDYYDQGWQPEGVLPVPSVGSVCDGNCRCEMLRRQVPVDQAATIIGTKG